MRTSLTGELVREVGVKGGVTLYRGAGCAARRYLESDRSLADEYYLEGVVAIADFAVIDACGLVVDQRSLNPGEYAGWVDWTDPISGVSMGMPRQSGEAGGGVRGSPRWSSTCRSRSRSLRRCILMCRPRWMTLKAMR
ncbi:hypothetical protein [Microbacterium hominis]|uniref:hypothetical protein n=1 Tax=Microbacterium hominis TaxID=162426 RepID=UPI0020B686AD|nr:hypothetical protein [Microbacterium hominis]